MYTVCPKCALTLLVTAGDLRVAEGYVRCGRCANVFNALPRLSEERPAPGAFPTEPDSEAPAPARPLAGPASMPTRRSGPQAAPRPGSGPESQSGTEVRSTAGAARAQPPPAGPPIEVPARASKPLPPAVATPRPPAATMPLPRPTPAEQAAARLRAPGAPSQPAAPPRRPPVSPAFGSAPAAPRTPPPPATQAVTGEDAPATATTAAREAGAAPVPEYDAVPDSELEFDADSTDVNEVFVVPPPDPAWAAETNSFRATLSAIEANVSAARPEAPAPQTSSPAVPAVASPAAPSDAPPAAPAPSTAPEPESQHGELEFELDADLLSATLAGHSMAAELHADLEAAPPTRHDPVEEKPASTPASPVAPAAEPVPVTRDATADWPMPAPLAAEFARHAGDPAARPAPPPPPLPPPASAPVAVQERPETRKPEQTPGLPPPPPHQVERTLGLDRGTRPAQRAAMPGLDTAELGWRYAAVVLGLALVLQVIHHFRNELAADPRVGHPVRALYSVVGIPLVPRWDLHAYDVRQLGASVDGAAAGRITVRASIKNAGQHAQPMPLLRVMLEDRFGNRIAARDVAPASYLPGVHGERFLAAGQRVDAQMSFVDPGANAVGFELDACLPAAGGGIACANDSP